MLTESLDSSSDRDATNTLNRVDVWLIEINSSPAVAEKLLPVFAKKLIELAIDSVFDREDSLEEEGTISSDQPSLSNEYFITIPI